MERKLNDLPTEILDLVLQSLPLADLLSFARTSKSNYELAVQALTALDLAVFPRRIHSLLAFLDAGNDDDEDQDKSASQWSRVSANQTLYQVGLITNSSRSRLVTSKPNSSNSQKHKASMTEPPPRPTPLALRTAEMVHQNSLAVTALSASSLSSLRQLTVRLYDLTSADLATTLATKFPNLRSLTLDFSHPYIHDTILPAGFWRDTPATGSPIWNIICGIGGSNATALKLRNLQRINVTRSNITCFQLRNWIESNPELQELKASTCRGVDREFVDWLGEYVSNKNIESRDQSRSKMYKIQLQNCGNLTLNSASDFKFIDKLSASGTIRELNLSGCKGVNEEMFCDLAANRDNDSDDIEKHSQGHRRGWHGICKLVSPKGVVFRHTQTALRSPQLEVQRPSKGIITGSASPALTVSDGMMNPNIGVGGSYFGKVEADPAALQI